MQTSKKFAVLTGFLLLGGCNTPTPQQLPSPSGQTPSSGSSSSQSSFQGHWVQIASSPQSELTDLTIGADWTLQANVKTPKGDFLAKGKLQENGDLAAEADLTNDLGAARMDYSGKVTIDQKGHLVGTIKTYGSATTVLGGGAHTNGTLSIDMERKD